MKKWLLMVLAICFSLTAQAADQVRYEEGVQYQRIAQPVATTTGDRIEVVEMFGYPAPIASASSLCCTTGQSTRPKMWSWCGFRWSLVAVGSPLPAVITWPSCWQGGRDPSGDV